VTYLGLNTIFLGLAVLLAVATLWLRPSSRRLIPAAGLALAVVLLLTAVFDNIMIGVGLVAYDPELISGVFVGLAPVEDFAYPVGAALLLPALWSLLGGDTRPGDQHPRAATAPPHAEGQDE
jgi:lycopene cyclase domain-containing protein